jgi:hypothetical protein
MDINTITTDFLGTQFEHRAIFRDSLVGILIYSLFSATSTWSSYELLGVGTVLDLDVL